MNAGAIKAILFPPAAGAVYRDDRLEWMERSDLDYPYRHSAFQDHALADLWGQGSSWRAVIRRKSGIDGCTPCKTNGFPSRWTSQTAAVCSVIRQTIRHGS